MNLPRMRYAREAYEEIKEADPETRVTVNLIRGLIKTGAVPSVPTGNNRRLVNMESLKEYLSAPVGEQGKSEYGKIRKVDENGKG